MALLAQPWPPQIPAQENAEDISAMSHTGAKSSRKIEFLLTLAIMNRKQLVPCTHHVMFP